MPFRLRNNLHWCDSFGRAVFLDLSRDRYFCLPASLNEAFLQCARDDEESQISRKYSLLVECGILVEVDSKKQRFGRAVIEAVTHDFSTERSSYINVLRLACELRSELLVSRSLRKQPLLQVIEAVRRQPINTCEPSDGASALEAIVATVNSAAFFTRSHDRCLVRALVAHTACKNRGFKSKLVFGVIANPFAAHCWVQLGTTVLVGGFERSRLYVPILVVE